MTSRMTSSDPESTFVVHLDLKPISAKLQESNRRYFSRPLLLEAASKLEAAQAELRNDEDFSEVFAPALDGKLVKVWPPARLRWTGGMGINLNWTGWAAQGKHAPLDIGAHPRRPKFWGPLFRLSSNADVVEDEVEDEADMRILGTQVLNPALCDADGRALSGTIGSVTASTNELLSTDFLDISHESMTSMTAAWHAPNNPIRAHFEATLDSQFNLHSNSGPAVQIKNIVCLGLGTMHPIMDGFFYAPGLPVDQAAEHKHQHMFASYLSAYLSTYYASHGLLSPTDTFPIPVYAHDPAYTSRDIALLSQIHPPITVLSDPYHYLQIDKHTLVIAISVAKTVPYLEIMADLLRESGGPAAILVNTILEREENAQGLVHSLDVCTPPVVDMMKGYKGKPVLERDFGIWEEGMPGFWMRGEGENVSVFVVYEDVGRIPT